MSHFLCHRRLARIFSGRRDRQHACKSFQSISRHTALARLILSIKIGANRRLRILTMVRINVTSLVAFLIIAVTIQTVAGQTTFDWGRPCTLVTSASKSEIDPSCQDCGSGSSANPAKACNFKDLTVPASQPINFHYHSSTHNLYVGSSRCAYTTEICPSASAEMISQSSPCKYTPSGPGTFYISDKANDYCNTFDASLKVTAT